MPQSKRSRLGALVAICTLFVVMAIPASASHVVGMKVTVTNADAGTMTADVDVTGYATAGYPYTTLWLGFSNTAAYVPAIDWGDGSVVPPYGYGSFTGIPIVATSTVISGVNVDVFRGSFSHVFPGEGPYTITAASPVNSPPPTTVITGTQTTVNSVGVMFGTATVTFGGDNPLEIPTTTELGLLLLALSLAGAAIFMLRR